MVWGFAIVLRLFTLMQHPSKLHNNIKGWTIQRFQHISTKTTFINDILSSVRRMQDWQTVKTEYLYVYSAYHDYRQNKVVIISVLDKSIKASSIKCCLWFDSQQRIHNWQMLLYLLIQLKRWSEYWLLCIHNSIVRLSCL